jgi:hypothetical protein
MRLTKDGNSMPTKAIVAYETDDEGVFDLHFSMNGGERFHLKPYLDHYLDGNLTKTLLEITAEKPGDFDDDLIEWVESHERAVQPRPRSTDVPLQEIGQQINFLHIEALYLVRETGVETYVPVWIYPDVLRALREMVELTVYPLEAFDPRTGIDQTANILAEIAGDDFTSESLANPQLRRFVEENHQGILQTVIGQIRDAHSQSDLERTGLVMNEAVHIDPITTEGSLPGSDGRGVFVEVTYDDEAEKPVDQESVMTTGQVHRVAQARALDNEAAGDPSTDELLRSELSIVAELIRRYGARVAEFSPSPYDEYVDSYFDRLGVRASADGPQYRVMEVSQEVLNVAEHRREQPKDGSTASTETPKFEVHAPDVTQHEKAVLNRLSKGDIVRAVLDQTVSPATVASISFEHHCPMAVSSADVRPDVVEEIYSESLGAENQNSDEQEFSGVKAIAPSTYESLSGEEIAVAELFLAEEPEGEVQWESVLQGEMPVALNFAHFDGEPTEIIACNPPSTSYWYLFSFRFERTGLATELRDQLSIPYESLAEKLQ